MIVWKLKY